MKTMFLKPGEIEIDRVMLPYCGTDLRRLQYLVKNPEALQIFKIAVIHYQGHYFVLNEVEPLLALQEISNDKPIACAVYECENWREITEVLYQRRLERDAREKENDRQLNIFMRKALCCAKKKGISLADAVIKTHLDGYCRAVFSQ